MEVFTEGWVNDRFSVFLLSLVSPKSFVPFVLFFSLFFSLLSCSSLGRSFICIFFFLSLLLYISTFVDSSQRLFLVFWRDYHGIWAAFCAQRYPRGVFQRHCCCFQACLFHSFLSMFLFHVIVFCFNHTPLLCLLLFLFYFY